MRNKSDLNSQLRSWKVIAALAIALALGLLATVFSSLKNTQHQSWPAYLDWIPLLPIGETLISTALIGLTFEFFVRHENERAIRAAIDEALKATSSELTLDLLGSAEAVDRLAPEERDRVLTEVLASWSGDRVVANEIERFLLPQFLSRPNYWRDLRYDVQLSADSSENPESSKYVEAIVSCEYEAILEQPAFVALLDWTNQELLRRVDAQVHEYDYVLTVGGVLAYDWRDPDAFDYLSIEINGVALNLRRDIRELESGEDGQVLVTGTNPMLLSAVGKSVRHRIVARLKLPKRGHFFSYTLIRTAMGLTYRARVDKNDLAFRIVDVVPALPGSGPVQVATTAVRGRYEASFNTSRTVLAGSTVFLTWTMEGEYRADFNFGEEGTP